jgi:hypothetical protein
LSRDTINDRAMALLLLERTYHSAHRMADRIDPKRKRPDDALLKALDMVLSTCARVLYHARAGVRLDGADLLSKEWHPKAKRKVRR